MSYWICCNSCFLAPSTDRKLAITTCGHVICSVCYQTGKPGECLICNAKCQVSPLTDKSSAEVKALFSDINVVAAKHLTEIGKVIMFQARHQKRLLTYYQKRNEKLEEVFIKMKHEMQQMTKKLTDQSAYINRLEYSLQHQSSKASSGSQMSHSSHTAHGQKTDKMHKSEQNYFIGPGEIVLQIPYNSPVSLSRHSSALNVAENMEVDDGSVFRKPVTVPRLSLISPPQDGRMGTISHRSSSQNTLATVHSACSATVSRFQEMSPGWKSPLFKPAHPFRHSSASSLVFPPP